VGTLRPEGGTVSVAGYDVNEQPLAAKARLGYVPESGALYGLLTIREHLEMVSDLYDMDGAVARARVEHFVAQLGLGGLAGQRIDTLSKGQRQKTLLATALLHDPDVLLLDEPLNGLDANAARQFKDTIRGLAARGKAVLFCSHILDVVERICDRAIIIDAGRIVADAPTAELVARSADATLESVFHSLVRTDDVEGLADAFLAAPEVSRPMGPRGPEK
jgi:ABC-2 type transport system ATP-binding protein